MKTATSRLGRKYLLKKSVPDVRDFHFRVDQPIVLPPSVDLRPQCPPVYDQGQLGSCTANGLGFAHQFLQMKQRGQSFVPSRLFIYRAERVMEGTVNEDAGAQIRDGAKVLAQLGVCDEVEWPYDVSKFTVQPTDQCFADALNNQITSYWSVAQNRQTIKQCLAQGFPVVIGITIYSSFESATVARTGVVPMPRRGWFGDKVLGGHCVALVGYDDTKNCYIVRNSWGTGWGDKGYFYLPQAYLDDPSLACDFWTLRLVE